MSVGQSAKAVVGSPESVAAATVRQSEQEDLPYTRTGGQTVEALVQVVEGDGVGEQPIDR